MASIIAIFQVTPWSAGTGLPLNFRDVLLRSQALELLARSFIAVAPVSAEEEAILTALLSLCLHGGSLAGAATVAGLRRICDTVGIYGADPEVLMAMHNIMPNSLTAPLPCRRTSAGPRALLSSQSPPCRR